LKTFRQYIAEATTKRLCNGPNCGVKTSHVVDSHPETGNAVWRCENCGTMTPKTTRTSAKKAALDDLFNKLSEEKDEWPHERIQKLTKHVRSVLSDDLRKKYKGNPNKMAGHCYVASEAIHHMTGGKHTTPQVMRVPGGTHWWLKHNKTGKHYDPTGDQFDHKVDHSQGKGCGFLTKGPSKRAQEVIRRVKEKHPEYRQT
jgi:hypothetical protein